MFYLYSYGLSKLKSPKTTTLCSFLKICEKVSLICFFLISVNVWSLRLSKWLVAMYTGYNLSSTYSPDLAFVCM